MRWPPACGMRAVGLRRSSEFSGVFAVDQNDQRFAESFDAVGGSARLREVQTGGGRDAVGDVAAAAPGFFEDRVERLRELDALSAASPSAASAQNTDQQLQVLPGSII